MTSMLDLQAIATKGLRKYKKKSQLVVSGEKELA